MIYIFILFVYLFFIYIQKHFNIKSVFCCSSLQLFYINSVGFINYLSIKIFYILKYLKYIVNNVD